ncbi:POK8 protein, partial [Ciconia maguari]|nr:POK8 protein [Ciconia maguari]
PVVVLDIKDCFFSIPLAPQDRERFAFTVPSLNLKKPARRYQWKVLPQGMKNSPVICQRVVSVILEPVRKTMGRARMIHYMDDILLAAPSRGEVKELQQKVI